MIQKAGWYRTPAMIFNSKSTSRRATIPITLLILTLGGCFAAPVYEGEVTRNFDGKVFFNRERMEKTPLDMMSLGWGMLTKAEAWPVEVDNPTPESVPENVTRGVQVTYINHATTLVQMDGLNILTDPIYSERASPLSWAGPKRVREPGILLADLPPIDVVLISHNHYDHLDIETLQKLTAQQEKAPLILAGLGNGELFTEIGLPDHLDMQWDQAEHLQDVTFTFVECRHRSGRGIADQMKTLWGSFVIQSKSGSVYFAGDTGYGPHLKEHGERYGPFDLSILPIGAYEPRWFMADVHMNPVEAAQAHIDLASKQSLSIHFGIFQLTFEAIDAPRIDLTEALKQMNLSSEAFWTLEPGQTKSLATSYKKAASHD